MKRALKGHYGICWFFLQQAIGGKRSAARAANGFANEHGLGYGPAPCR
jgi:hypothetical protein